MARAGSWRKSSFFKESSSVTACWTASIMFSDTRVPGEHRGFQHSNPHLNLWLHNGLRAHHSEMGLNGQCGRADANLTYPNRVKKVGFTSQEVMNNRHGKERTGPHLNELCLETRRLCFGLWEHRVQPDLRSQEGSPSRWSHGQSPAPGLRHRASVRDYYTERSFVGNARQSLLHPSVRKYVKAPALAQPTQFKGQDGCKVPVCLEDQLWGYSRQTCQRDLHTSSWVDSATATQGLPRHQSFSSTLRSNKKNVRNSQRDLTRPVSGPETKLHQQDLTRPLEGYNGPSSLHVIFSTEVPQRDMGGPTLRPQQSLSKPCPTLEDIRTRPPRGDQGSRSGSGLTGSKKHQKVVRDQIRRVVENLEEVLGGLKDIHQEMKEVVQQIELLTSSIDLSEEASPSLPGDSSSSGVAKGSSHQRLRGEEARQGEAALSSPIRTNSLQPHNPASSLVCLPHQPAPSPHRSSPVRPPTPALPPSVPTHLTPTPLLPQSRVSITHTTLLLPPKEQSTLPPQPYSLSQPWACPQKSSPPHPSALGLSVTIANQAGPPIVEPLPVRPPRDPETRVEGLRPTSAKSLGLTQSQMAPHGPGRVPGTRGRKPPPYPHNGHFDRVSKGKDPRKVPPYTVKRRLLSTTV